MTLRDHFTKMFQDIAMVSGAIIIVRTVFMLLNGIDGITTKALCGLVLLGATVVFRAESLVNFHKLEEHVMHVNYLVSSVLSDITLLFLLYYFTPGGRYFKGMWVVLVAYILCKGLFYLSTYLLTLRSAREINLFLKNR